MSLFSLQTEVCDETFTKECSISFVQETSQTIALVCYNKAGKVCDEENTTELKPLNREDPVSTCVDVFDTGKPIHKELFQPSTNNIVKNFSGSGEMFKSKLDTFTKYSCHVSKYLKLTMTKYFEGHDGRT